MIQVVLSLLLFYHSLVFFSDAKLCYQEVINCELTIYLFIFSNSAFLVIISETNLKSPSHLFYQRCSGQLKASKRARY